jgi:hypothetical protein
VGVEGGRRGERKRARKKTKGRSNTKKYGCGFERGIFGGKKKPEQNHILLDTRDKSLLSGFLSLEKEETEKEKKKAFFVVTLVESS